MTRWGRFGVGSGFGSITRRCRASQGGKRGSGVPPLGAGGLGKSGGTPLPLWALPRQKGDGVAHSLCIVDKRNECHRG